MKKRLLYLVSSLLSIMVLASAFTDDDWLTTLLDKIESVRIKYPQEKVHLQLDKPYYSLGEDLWFKAYVVNSESNELSALSKILYVDVVDDRDSVRKTMALQIANGLANGDLKLNDSLFSAGNYRVRAYTRWMQNFSTDYVFSKNIIIGDARTNTGLVTETKFTYDQQSKLNAQITYLSLGSRTPLANKPVTYNLFYKEKSIATGRGKTDADGKIEFSISLKDQYKAQTVDLQTSITAANGSVLQRSFPVYNQSLKPDVQFFPESGRLVAGVRSKVAFKAMLPNGTGSDVKGTIVDQNNATIAEFASAHAGMGVFALQPVAGTTYTALINTGGTESRYPLPAASAEGYVLSLNHLGNDTLSVRVATSKTLAQGNEVALVALQNGVVKYTTKIKLDQPVINTRIAEQRFATGIVQFTLLSSAAVPLAERLVFVNHNDQLKMDISTNKPTYGKREKVQMQLAVKDNAGKPVEGNFSIAVTDESKVRADEDAETSIYSNLLLTSDLKGYVEKPNYYFTEPSEEKVRHLDFLLLTQGWRRFSWNDIAAGTLPAIKFQPQESLTVSGKITNLNNKPTANGKVTLYASTPQGMILIDTAADENGNFVFDKLEFNNDVRFVVRAKNAKDKNNVKIVLNKPDAYPHQFFDGAPDAALSNNFIDYITGAQKRIEQLNNGQMGNSIMLNEVKIKEKKIWVDRNAIKGSSRVGAGTPDIVIKKEKLTGQINLLSAFYGLAGIEVKNNQVYRIGRVSSITQPNGQPMLIMLNGIAIQPDMLKDIAPADVEGIEILKSGANTTIYGEEGVWGVVIITLKSGASGYIYVPPTYMALINLNGYPVEREFYSPAYDKPKDSDKLPDLRSTIFWQPNIVTDPQGMAKLSYFTADGPGTYRVVAEGINLEGKIVRKVFTYKVN